MDEVRTVKEGQKVGRDRRKGGGKTRKERGKEADSLRESTWSVQGPQQKRVFERDHREPFDTRESSQWCEGTMG